MLNCRWTRRRNRLNDEEILDILKKINIELGRPVTDELFGQIISLVIKNPLDEDRGKCQDQILEIINQIIGGSQ